MGKTVKKEECTCCHVHTTWRERPIPKHEVTIEMIANLNKQYRSLYNISVEQNKRMDRLVKLTEETANFLLILGKRDDCTQLYGTESRKQYEKLLKLTIGDPNEEG